MGTFKKDQGLTVAELLVSIALVAIVAAIVFPVFNNVIASAQADANARSVKAVQNFVKEYEHWNLAQVGADIVASMPDGTEIARITGTCGNYCAGGGNNGGGGGGTNGGGGGGTTTGGGSGPNGEWMPGDYSATLRDGLLRADGSCYFYQSFQTKSCVQFGLYAAGGRVFSFTGVTGYLSPYFEVQTAGLSASEITNAGGRATSTQARVGGWDEIIPYTVFNKFVINLPGMSISPYNGWQQANDGQLFLTVNGSDIQVGTFTIGY